MIGLRSAEDLKISIGTAFPVEEEKYMEVRGRNLVTGLPVNLTISSSDLLEAMEETITSIADAVHSVLEKTPPELISDIIDRGVALCGGGALLNGVDKYLTKALGIPAYLVDNPMTCTAEGAARAFGMRNVLKRSLNRV